MIARSVIRQIEEQIDIVEFISHYVTFTRRADCYWACCPFHIERTPSFSVSSSKRVYHCFGCKKSGNLFQFVMEMEKLSFVDAVKYLANRLGIDIEKERVMDVEHYQQKSALLILYQRITKTFEYYLWNTKEGEQALCYLKDRGLSEKTLKCYRLGYAPSNKGFFYRFLTHHGYSKEILEQSGLFTSKNSTLPFFYGRVVFPIMQTTGEVIAFSGRLLSTDKEHKSPKYLNSPDTIIYNKKCHLYGFFQAKNSLQKEGFMLCEGAMDVCAMFEMGYKNAVASLGTGFTENQAKSLKDYTEKGCILFDNDIAGEKASKKVIFLCTKQELRIRILEHESEKDPGEILEKKNFKGLQKSLDNAKIPLDFLVNEAGRIFSDANFGAFDVCQTVFPFIRILSSPILRDGALKYLASRVDLREGVVFDEFRRFSQSYEFLSDFVGGAVESVRFQGTIYELLGVFLRNPSIYDEFSSFLKGFWLDTYESQVVLSYLEGDQLVDFTEWLANQDVFDDDLKGYLLREFCAGVSVTDGSRVRSIIGLLELKRLEKKRLELEELIKQVEERDGDVASVTDLMGDYVLVVQKLQELRAGL